MGVRIKRGAWFEAPKLSPDKFFLTVRKNLLRDNFGASNHTKIKSCRTPLGEITALPHTLYLLALEREGGKEKRERNCKWLDAHNAWNGLTPMRTKTDPTSELSFYHATPC